MADTVFQIIEGSELRATTNSKILVTRGIVSNLTATLGAEDAEVIWAAKAAVEANGYVLGSLLSGGHPEMTFQQMIIRGIANNACSVELHHETPLFGGPASAVIIRDRAFLGSITANTYTDVTGGKTPVLVNGITLTSNEKIPEDYGSITYPSPMRAIQMSALTYGAPANGGQDAVGCVNNANWKGKPLGYWLLTDFQTDVSRYAGYYTMSATALTQVRNDWSVWSILRSEKTGKFAKATANSLSFLNGKTYFHGQWNQPGITKVGPHPLANFASIFGVF